MAAEAMEIDDSLYSRQRYVLGDSAMHRMAASSVLVYGMGGLGIEIAKNVVLAGIKALTIQDPKTAAVYDLGTQFFLREEDVKASRNRAEASCPLLAELNPYVTITKLEQPLTVESDLAYLTNYQCVILTDCPISVHKKVNDFCRSSNPQIKFISTDVYGIFGSVFADFGDQFEVNDATGEEPRDIFVDNITNANPGVVTCLETNMHQLETGDVVTFREVKGMTYLNGRQFPVKVIDPYKFSICDTSSPDFGTFDSGGIMTQVKISKTMTFTSLEQQIVNPSLLSPDLCKFSLPPLLHLAYLTINNFQEQKGRFPKPWDEEEAKEFIVMAKSINGGMLNGMAEVDEKLLSLLCQCSAGCLAPLCTVFGGIAAQEVLKSLTGKFTPLSQWLYLDACEVVPKGNEANSMLFQPRGDRYDSLRICIGQNGVEKLANTKLFMVGCGAIGCEMLKNYALLGVGSGNGKLTITDNDLIEKSNLNRQFLFRPRHIQKPKSTTAAQAALEINKDLNIEAQQHKVCPQTETSVYTDAFFEDQDLIVNALDNVEARRYVDGRCVSNQRALLESGTMGTKGHVQVIVPHITESYTSQQDPHDEDYPYCTVKHFPAALEHCIQWARDKFEEGFVQHPQLFNKFIQICPDLQKVSQDLINGTSIDGAVRVSKILDQRPYTWEACVCRARILFQKYFSHKAKQLLHLFPADHQLENGGLFWAPPRRTPTPVEFDIDDEMHFMFVVTTARLLADIYGVKYNQQVLEKPVIESYLKHLNVPMFKASSKQAITDETVKREEVMNKPIANDVVEESGLRIQQVLSTKGQEALQPLSFLEFEKDDDSNGHIDYITALTNLRARMYHIDQGDRLKIKKIAGRIVPAIATTTAAVSGLVTLELIKVLYNSPLEELKNCFLNLALPIVVLSEPGSVAKTVLREGLSVSIWDKWEVKGSTTFTLQQFMDFFKEKYGFDVQSIVQGVKIVFMPFMPGHMKRLPQPLTKLLKPVPDQKYVDLVVSFDGDGEEDVAGPPVRYFF